MHPRRQSSWRTMACSTAAPTFAAPVSFSEGKIGLLACLMHIPGRHFSRNLIERRNLLFQLVRRDFEQRFIGSAAGWLWGIIHPLVMLLSWVFVFQICLRFRLPEGEVTHNYALFLFCGMLPWLLFQDTVQRSASSLLDHANL